MQNALLQAAREAAQNAYCPYSHYSVGAAVLGDDNRIYRGCNVENASYGLTLCAERNAITTAIAAGCHHLLAIVVVGGTADAPAWPCGACRQVMSEFAAPSTPVTVAPLDPSQGPGTTLSLSTLLPHSFSV